MQINFACWNANDYCPEDIDQFCTAYKLISDCLRYVRSLNSPLNQYLTPYCFPH